MPEIWFYHLVGRKLESVLPTLLEKALEREWNVVVQFTSDERLAAMDEHLYTWSDESFLPHGSARDGDAEEQPIWLTLGDDNPNGAKLRICVDGARAEDAAKASGDMYDRIILIFDGGDEAVLLDSRAQWKALKAAGYALSYYQQNENGGWDKKA
ncbi:MAG: polymerase chi subunit HolC [Hyphomicrobiales bacterium]|nr:polymerase chi subunit HolC [Hyphomicrobiales bacterium]